MKKATNHSGDAMADVFISYSRADRAQAEQIAHALEGRGFDVWWDPDLLPGEQYSKIIADVLAKAKAVIVLWSKNSAVSNWVLDEAQIGAQRGALIPILIDNVEVPLGFRQHSGEDLTNWPNPSAEPAFERMVSALQRLRDGASHDAVSREGRANRNRLVNRLGLTAALVAGAAVAAVALSQILARDDTNGPPKSGPRDTTDSPGAANTFGFAPAELAAYSPRELIQVALERTTMEAIADGAARGDGLANTLLCLARFYGEELAAPDPAGARTACEQGADRGEGLALYQLSLMARDGVGGFAGDAGEADAFLERALAAGDPRAQTDRARALLDQNKDAEAAAIVEKAVAQRFPAASLLYGWMLEHGRGAPADPGRALQFYQLAGESGSAAGQREVGRMLEDGIGVNQDDAQARDRYAFAADLGDGEAAFRLARLLELGRGGEPDRAGALRNYRKAAQQGYAPAAAEAERLEAAADN